MTRIILSRVFMKRCNSLCQHQLARVARRLEPVGRPSRRRGASHWTTSPLTSSLVTASAPLPRRRPHRRIMRPGPPVVLSLPPTRPAVVRGCPDGRFLAQRRARRRLRPALGRPRPSAATAPDRTVIDGLWQLLFPLTQPSLDAAELQRL
jgi:hypothetical protein